MIRVNMGNAFVAHRFQVVRSLPRECLLGADFLYRVGGFRIDFICRTLCLAGQLFKLHPGTIEDIKAKPPDTAHHVSDGQDIPSQEVSVRTPQTALSPPPHFVFALFTVHAAETIVIPASTVLTVLARLQGPAVDDQVVLVESSHYLMNEIGVFMARSIHNSNPNETIVVNINELNGKTVYKVIVGAFPNKKDATSLLKDMKAAGVDGFVKNLKSFA